MKIVGYVFIVLVAIGVALFVFSKLYEPANLLIRKTFSSLTGFQMVSTEQYDFMVAENRVLHEQQQASIEKELEYRQEIQAWQQRYEDSAAVAEALALQLEDTEQELADAKAVFEEMTTTEQVMAFDGYTKGDKASFVFDHEGHEVVGTQVQRIADAVWQMHEGKASQAKVKILERIVEEKDRQIASLRGEVTALTMINQEKDKQLAMEVEKRMNVQEAMQEVKAQGRRSKAVGYLVAAAAVAVVIFL